MILLGALFLSLLPRVFVSYADIVTLRLRQLGHQALPLLIERFLDTALQLILNGPALVFAAHFSVAQHANTIKIAVEKLDVLALQCRQGEVDETAVELVWVIANDKGLADSAHIGIGHQSSKSLEI